jgi:cytochrome c-type biogenesis protein CcmH/NrfG
MEFDAKIAEGRARAYRAMNKLPLAVAAQEVAVSLTPTNAARWLALAELYAASGDAAKAEDARSHAAILQKLQREPVAGK